VPAPSQVEGLGAELQLRTLRYLEIFEDGKIEVPELREIEAVAAGVSNGAERRNHERW
jgi:hypothetical protein